MQCSGVVVNDTRTLWTRGRKGSHWYLMRGNKRRWVHGIRQERDRDRDRVRCKDRDRDRGRMRAATTALCYNRQNDMQMKRNIRKEIIMKWLVLRTDQINYLFPHPSLSPFPPSPPPLPLIHTHLLPLKVRKSSIENNLREELLLCPVPTVRKGLQTKYEMSRWWERRWVQSGLFV